MSVTPIRPTRSPKAEKKREGQMDNVAILISGTVLTLAGYFGPEDGGFLCLCGLVIVAVTILRIWGIWVP